jgi:hypothetical protein
MKSSNKIIRTLKEYPLAMFCVIVAFICGVLIFLRGGAAVELTAQEADLNSRILKIDQNAKNAKGLTPEVVEIQQLVQQIESKLFDRQERAVNINFFYSLEDRLEVRISNIDQEPSGGVIYEKGGVRELKLHSTIGYSISVNGQFDEILTFLYELSRVDPLIRIANCRITKSNDQGDSKGGLGARLRVAVLAVKN